MAVVQLGSIDWQGVGGMGRKRGFFAELQHQSAVAARNQARSQAAAAREQARSAREMERAQTRLERAGRAAAKASEQELARLKLEAREAETDAMNAELALRLSEIDSILKATLDVDDYVDLEALRKPVEYPPFASDHERPIPPPPAIQAPPEPAFIAPKEPKGLGAMFGGKKRYQATLTDARAAFAAQHEAWSLLANQVPIRQLEQLESHAKEEVARQRKLDADKAAHRLACEEHEQQIVAENAQLDTLIHDLAIGRHEAVEEYLGIVLGNSVYPDDLVAVSDFAYDVETHELAMELSLPRPDQLPTAREYRYLKAKDEIAVAPQPLKEQRERYASVVSNSALRTLHEVWESDRHGHVHTISLTGLVDHVHRATGKDARTALIAVAAAREQFTDIDLGRVKPQETLRHLNASISKDPMGLVPIDAIRGVRSH